MDTSVAGVTSLSSRRSAAGARVRMTTWGGFRGTRLMIELVLRVRRALAHEREDRRLRHDEERPPLERDLDRRLAEDEVGGTVGSWDAGYTTACIGT